MESNNIDNAICLNVKTGVYKRVRTMITGPEGTTIMFQDGDAVSFSVFSQDWIVDSEMTDEEFNEVSQLNIFNINNNNINNNIEEFDRDILTKPLKHLNTGTKDKINNNNKKNNNNNNNNNNNDKAVDDLKIKPRPEIIIPSKPVNTTVADLFSRLPDNVEVKVDRFMLDNFPVEFIRDFIKYFNINKEELAEGLLNKYKGQFKSLIIDYVCKENKD